MPVRTLSLVFSLIIATAYLPQSLSAQQITCNNGIVLRAGKEVSPAALTKLLSNAQKELKRTKKKLLTAKSAVKAKLQKKVKTLNASVKIYKQLLKSCIQESTGGEPNGDEPTGRIKITTKQYNDHQLVIFEDTKEYEKFELRDNLHIHSIDENGEAVLTLTSLATEEVIKIGSNSVYRWNGKKLIELCPPEECSFPVFTLGAPVNGRGIIGVSRTKVYQSGDDLKAVLWNERGYFPLEGYSRGDALIQEFTVNSKGEVFENEEFTGTIRRWNALDGKALPPLDLAPIVLPQAVQLENEEATFTGCAPLGSRRLEFSQFAMAADGTIGIEVTNKFDCTQYGFTGQGSVSAHFMIVNGQAIMLEGSKYSVSQSLSLPLRLEAVGSGGTALMRASDSVLHFLRGKQIRKTLLRSVYDRYEAINSQGSVIATRIDGDNLDESDFHVTLDVGTGPKLLSEIIGLTGETYFNQAVDINECGEIVGTLRYTRKIEELDKSFIAIPNQCK